MDRGGGGVFFPLRIQVDYFQVSLVFYNQELDKFLYCLATERQDKPWKKAESLRAQKSTQVQFLLHRMQVIWDPTAPMPANTHPISADGNDGSNNDLKEFLITENLLWDGYLKHKL